MKAKLKDTQFFKGNGQPIDIPRGETVVVTDTEDHHTFGKRYKISGCNEWFEENCFEYINQ